MKLYTSSYNVNSLHIGCAQGWTVCPKKKKTGNVPNASTGNNLIGSQGGEREREGDRGAGV